MQVIGLTGGVGSGKSTIVKLIQEFCNCRTLLTDEISREQMEPGGIAYTRVLQEFGNEILQEDKTIDRKKLAQIVFSTPDKLKKLNELTHPLVTEHVLSVVQEERTQQKHEILLIETALLIEGGYATFCDQVWYIHAPEEQRKNRLITSRGYTEEKITDLFHRQKTEEEFRKVATAVIENGDDQTPEKILEQLKKLLPNCHFKSQKKPK